jgi:hypothetical protein
MCVIYVLIYSGVRCPFVSPSLLFATRGHSHGHLCWKESSMRCQNVSSTWRIWLQERMSGSCQSVCTVSTSDVSRSGSTRLGHARCAVVRLREGRFHSKERIIMFRVLFVSCFGFLTNEFIIHDELV